MSASPVTVAARRWQTANYPIRLLSPAFLGGADQNAAWRTPPLKALLRQWWRVAWTAENRDAGLQRMREEEGRLFGTVTGEVTQSQIRLRLQEKTAAREVNLPKLDAVTHPEVKREGKVMPIDPLLYLGYGPYNSRRSYLTGDGAVLRLAFPTGAEAVLSQTVQLASWFGSVGSRSRNGWGSLEFGGAKSFEECRAEVVAPCCRTLLECLQTDWPDAIGSDGRPLVWTSRTEFGKWEEAMRELAQMKIRLRTQFKFTRRGQFEQRHFFGLPITHHELGDRQQRWASQLRFRLVSVKGRLRIVAVHLPARVPAQLPRPDYNELEFWKSVHKYLDGDAGWARLQ